jgi:hypothetical protein
MKTMEMAVKAVTTVIALFVVNVATVDASDQQTVSLNELQSFFVDAMDVIEDLDSYSKLWIKPHSCVWSECAVDDTDDGYTGDNRDGDEQWYQYRTQGFCANAAYSLYGVKKTDQLIPSFSGCSRRHFINSFFTYGGADTLLKAVGETPTVYGNDGNGNYNNGDDDGYSTNAACTEIDYESDDDYDGGNDEERNLGSNDNDGDGYGATLGCSADGKYVIAAFQSESCDGNYFAGVIDEFKSYNKQHNSIGCHKIYGSRQASNENVVNLLSNSWSCDLRLYPNGCPDPYGNKEKYDFAVRTVAHGGNPYLAYKNMMLRTPILVASWIFLAITVLIVVVTYLVKNEYRAQSKGGKNLLGFSRCLLEDVTLGFRNLGSRASRKRQTVVDKMEKSKRKKRRRKSKNKRKQNRDEEIYPEVTVTDNSDATRNSDAAYANIDDVEN